MSSCVPAACDKTMRRCKSFSLSGGIRVFANNPKPVLMPYTTLPSAKMLRTVCCERSITCRASACNASCCGASHHWRNCAKLRVPGCSVNVVFISGSPASVNLTLVHGRSVAQCHTPHPRDALHQYLDRSRALGSSVAQQHRYHRQQSLPQHVVSSPSQPHHHGVSSPKSRRLRCSIAHSITANRIRHQNHPTCFLFHG